MAFEENEYKGNHLQKLSGSDYEIVDGEPDITGWDVLDDQGQKIGEVDDMLFDPEAQKVRYIIVELEDGELNLPDGKKVLIPIGVAALRSDDGFESDSDDAILANDPRLDETVIDVNDGEQHLMDRGTRTLSADDEPLDADTVYDEDEDEDEEEEFTDIVIVSVSEQQLRDLPEYDSENLSPNAELATRRVFEGNTENSGFEYDRNGFYNHEYFDTDKFYDRGATTRSNLPVSESSLDEPLDEKPDGTEPPASTPFDDDIERRNRGGGYSPS